MNKLTTLNILITKDNDSLFQRNNYHVSGLKEEVNNWLYNMLQDYSVDSFTLYKGYIRHYEVIQLLIPSEIALLFMLTFTPILMPETYIL